LNTQLTVLALSAILISSIGLAPAFAQITELVVVTTDKSSYSDGDTIMVSGEVKEILSGFAVTIQVIAPNGNLVRVEQLEVGSDKMFSFQITAGGKLWKSEGTYTIKVLYGTAARTAETTFEFGGTTDTTSTSTTTPTGPTFAVTDTPYSVGFQITGGNILNIMPDVDAASLIIQIETTGDGQLTITLPRSLMDATIGDQDDEFFVLIDGEEVDFDEKSTETDRTLTIDFYDGTEEIEIIGTFVVPEFGVISAMVLAVAFISIIAVTAKTRLRILSKH